MYILPKYAYTAYSSKITGFLVLSNKDWDEFCDSQGGKHREVGGFHVLVLNNDLDDDTLLRIVENNEHRRDTMGLCRAVLHDKDWVRLDEHLAEAVCW